MTVEVLRNLGQRTGLFDLVHTEDWNSITADRLREFDAVLFFTSGELALSESQKQALLAFVSGGEGFGGFHSATDTLYSWAEYGELIGGYFDGHPWTQSARVLVTDPAHSVAAGLPSPWTLVEEYYQFRDFRPSRVLLALDKTSVDMSAPGVKAQEFPLAWTREWGQGRVFYTALGHFEGTWTNPVFARLLENAMRHLLRAETVAIDGVGNAASMAPLDTGSPGSLISIYGRNLGARVRVNGIEAPVLFASATQVNARVPPETKAISCEEARLMFCQSPFGVTLQVTDASGNTAVKWLRFADRTPGLFAATTQGGAVTLWMTGLGGSGSEGWSATVGGRTARILYLGEAPGFPGLDQVNIEVPAGLGTGAQQLRLMHNAAPGEALEIMVTPIL